MQIENVFSMLPQVTTDRLALRRVRQSDLDDIYAYASDPDVSRYTSWAPHTSPDETRQFVRRVLDAYLEKRVANWGIELKAERKLIGMGGYVWWDPLQSAAELGYVIGKPYWGQGLMTEAVKAMIDFGFQRMALNRVVIRMDPRNIGSWRVAEKSGCRFEGIARQAIYAKGKFDDLMVWAILREEWQPRGGR
ncbi:MAG TPA: GNAT family protein [Candidatus Limnocylindria bacterium]